MLNNRILSVTELLIKNTKSKINYPEEGIKRTVLLQEVITKIGMYLIERET